MEISATMGYFVIESVKSIVFSIIIYVEMKPVPKMIVECNEDDEV